MWRTRSRWDVVAAKHEGGDYGGPANAGKKLDSCWKVVVNEVNVIEMLNYIGWF